MKLRRRQRGTMPAVARHARARDAAEVEADVESLSIHPSMDDAGHSLKKSLQVEEFIVGEFLELPLVGLRADEQVAVVVRETIQHHD